MTKALRIRTPRSKELLPMNILIVNVHSALNLGDDAIMLSTVHSLRSTFPNAKIVVAANDPESWRKHAEIEVIGSLTRWVVDRSEGNWRWRKYWLPLYLVFLASVA